MSSKKSFQNDSLPLLILVMKLIESSNAYQVKLNNIHSINTKIFYNLISMYNIICNHVIRQYEGY